MASSAKDLVRRARVGGHRDTPPNALHELKRIADHYRAELVPLAELEHAASRHGSPLPAGLHPSVHSAQADSSPTAGNVDVATEETTPDAPNATQESSTQSHRAADAPDQTPASGPAKRIGSYALTALPHSRLVFCRCGIPSRAGLSGKRTGALLPRSGVWVSWSSRSCCSDSGSGERGGPWSWISKRGENDSAAENIARGRSLHAKTVNARLGIDE